MECTRGKFTNIGTRLSVSITQRNREEPALLAKRYPILKRDVFHV